MDNPWRRPATIKRIFWDATTGQPTHTLRGHTTRVKSVVWSPDGTRLASGSDDHTVKFGIRSLAGRQYRSIAMEASLRGRMEP